MEVDYSSSSLKMTGAGHRNIQKRKSQDAAKQEVERKVARGAVLTRSNAESYTFNELGAFLKAMKKGGDKSVRMGENISERRAFAKAYLDRHKLEEYSAPVNGTD